MLEAFAALWHSLPLVLQVGFKIAAILFPLLAMVAYYTFAERKVIAYMQLRVGPNRVGPRGWLQPIADAIKLMFKEIIIPTNAERQLFLIAPVLALAPALAAWAVVPFTDTLVLADIDASLLFVLALTSLGVYGVIIAGWASNSKYAFLGAMRSAAQIVAYEIAMGFALVGVLMAAGSLNLREIVLAQAGGFFSGISFPYSRFSWCIWCQAWPRPIAPRSTSRKANLRLLRDSTWNIREWRLPCFFLRSTPT